MKINAVQITLLICALLIIGSGIYMTFVADKPMGAVFIALGSTIAALSAIVGGIAKNKELDE